MFQKLFKQVCRLRSELFLRILLYFSFLCYN